MSKGERRGALAAGVALLGAAAGYTRWRDSCTKAGGIDYASDPEANFAAGQLAQALTRDLSSFAGYAGLRIVRYGIEVSTVGPPGRELRAAVARNAQRYLSGEIPVRFRLVRYSLWHLEALTRQLAADAAEWAGQGIELSTWGPSTSGNRVEIGLAHYTDAYRDALVSRYGTRVTVTPRNVWVVPA